MEYFIAIIGTLVYLLFGFAVAKLDTHYSNSTKMDTSIILFWVIYLFFMSLVGSQYKRNS